MPLSRKAKADFNAKLRDVPHKPGVYLMRDRLNRVIYVGKARDLRKRVGSYFMPSRKMSADLKTRAMIESVWDFEVHTVKSEPEALLLEGKLIKEYRPRYNISFRDDKRFLLVKVNFRRSHPALPVDPAAARGWGALLRAVRALGGVARDVERDAGQVRVALVPAGPAGGDWTSSIAWRP